MALQIPSPDTIPNYLLPTWTDEVMLLFANDELIDGNPTVAGLRRVAEIVIGPIISSRPTQVFPVNGDGPGRATVSYTVTFHDHSSPMGVLEFGDVADVWIGNSDPLFVGFAVAAAATRAEGRALRKALKLKKVAAEELTKVDDPQDWMLASIAELGARVVSDEPGSELYLERYLAAEELIGTISEREEQVLIAGQFADLPRPE